jgi:transposase InsO family protein
MEEMIILLQHSKEVKQQVSKEKHSITNIFPLLSRCLKKLFYFFTPENLIAIHRKAFKSYWHAISIKKNPGRVPIDKEIRELIRLIAKENHTWGAPRIHGELLKLGFKVSERSVSRYLGRIRKEPDGGIKMKWKTFLQLQREGVAGTDFFTVPTLSFRQLYGFFIIDHKTRKLLHFNVTYHPTSCWLKEQLLQAFSHEPRPKSITFDRASIFSPIIFNTLNSLGIEPKQIDIRSPWQNGIAERWVGNCRRDLLDHVIILNQQHLYRLMKNYVEYYNADRTHYSLDKETPLGRPVLYKQGDDDKVISLPRCYDLHHKYVWKKSA